ncbi:ATP-binding protein [Paenibacillus sp. FSL R5-0713]|uniref:ATP-binding protein n=1 Tax=Paenibacillus sp. FSL R5-0713 TaxID=2921655 RepID=UPI0030DDAA4B
MQNSDSTIYFNFSYFALKLLGKGLYSNHWTAIAELVANGLDAQGDNIKIYINMKDKENAVIEILDNGHGMGYEDLAEKYVLIGRDKRDDDQIDEEIKKQLMGRKGIGKLAALYLSNKYYIISKTVNESSAWCLDASNVKDSDVPRLDRIEIDQLKIETAEEWESFQTGTMIRLTNVDLTYFGEKTLAGLKARLADFYLTDTMQGEIEAAILTDKSSKKKFEKVEKSIAFKNIYAIYNNTDIDFSNRLAESVVVRSSIESVMATPRYVEKLDLADFQVRGSKKFLKPDGSYTSQELEYEMSGWIGIHTSIQNEDAKLNDIEYLKNKAYRPNQLRLYVRNKLSVENFLEYIKNTQAFSNYIEGEISFNLLDHNELGDIATSNRQGFVEKDERVQLLISILKPIINSLIRKRVQLGQKIKAEETAIYEEEKRIEAELRRIEEEKRIEAERLREEEEQKRIIVEQQVEGLDNQLKITSNTLNNEKKRNHFLVSSLSEDQFMFAEKLHMVRINISTIESIVKNLVMKLQRGRFVENDAWVSLKTLSYLIKRIHATLEYGGFAQFNTKEEFTEGNLFEFIVEYCEIVLTKYTNIKVLASIDKNISYNTRFSSQDVAVILENVISNSIKYQADILNIRMYKEGESYVIDLFDNGIGLDAKIVDVDELFDFGKSYSVGGTGVGLYHVKEITKKKLNGNVEIKKGLEKGFGLQIRM